LLKWLGSIAIYFAQVEENYFKYLFRMEKAIRQKTKENTPKAIIADAVPSPNPTIQIKIRGNVKIIVIALSYIYSCKRYDIPK